MNARQYLDKHGRDKARELAERAGTNLPYFEQLACGARAPSFTLAERLVAADEGGDLDVLSLMRAKSERDEARQSAGASPEAA